MGAALFVLEVDDVMYGVCLSSQERAAHEAIVPQHAVQFGRYRWYMIALSFVNMTRAYLYDLGIYSHDVNYILIGVVIMTRIILIRFSRIRSGAAVQKTPRSCATILLWNFAHMMLSGFVFSC